MPKGEKIKISKRSNLLLRWNMVNNLLLTVNDIPLIVHNLLEEMHSNLELAKQVQQPKKSCFANKRKRLIDWDESRVSFLEESPFLPPLEYTPFSPSYDLTSPPSSPSYEPLSSNNDEK